MQGQGEAPGQRPVLVLNLASGRQCCSIYLRDIRHLLQTEIVFASNCFSRIVRAGRLGRASSGHLRAPTTPFPAPWIDSQTTQKVHEGRHRKLDLQDRTGKIYLACF